MPCSSLSAGGQSRPPLRRDVVDAVPYRRLLVALAAGRCRHRPTETGSYKKTPPQPSAAGVLFSMMEVGLRDRFLLRQAELRLAQLDGLHQERHVASQRPHGLHSLLVLPYLLRRVAVDHVPILAAGHRHAAYSEVLVQRVEGGGVAAAPAGAVDSPKA